jgi:hypothetical protein
VWAVDELHAPLYWFPRQCPRGAVWARDDAERSELSELFQTTAVRLHVTELEWLLRMRGCELYAYRLDASLFQRRAEAEGQWIAFEPVAPLSVEPVGDLLARHAAADIELRYTPNLWPFWDKVVESRLPFSGVRLSNAAARPG